MTDFINNQNLQGQAISSMRRYLVEVHGTLLQTLVNLMNDYSTNLLLYKDGYYQIDSHLHTKLPGQEFTRLHSDLKGSRDKLKNEIEVLNTTKDKISDLVSYDGSSHTSTVMDYNFLLNQIKNLDSSITQYESNHASQDLVAFKELLAATKALIAEHAGKTRTVGTYQSGDFAKLKSVQRFAIAYKQATQQMESRVERVKAAQERDKVRFEALAAEDRAKNGWKELGLGVLTFAIGFIAIIGSLGTATPLVVAGGVVGFGTSIYGLSNVSEGIHNIELGNAGDIHTKSINPVRDTLFMGNDKLYHDVGNVFTTASAIMIPIGQTQSVVKGLTQFAIGEAAAYTAGQVAYHGTKLLGGSEEDAQTANFIGNLVGGYAVSSAASKFSLNKVKDAFSTNTKKYTLNSDRLSNLELYTSPEIKAIINKAGYSLEDFSNLVDADTTLSAKTDAFVKAVRKEIGIPAPKTKMNKTIPTEFVESYLSGERNSFAGFVSVDEHSKSLTTLPEIVEGNRLDYPNTPFDLEKTKTYAKISFFLDEADKLDIPFGELDNASYPFTGRGFTGSKNIILPEYKLIEERNFMDGDLITIFESKSGNPIRQYKYVENKGWKLIK
ncbi:hypothetical protein B7711_01010 [Streptococcus oralis subsp. oralis]|uniref:LXG domain-containing protein n=1 Tax=Streptococcus oralis subsp. oralis TaxID=1891914 RepID=A0ABD6RRW5_STROR|nr:hypothetical protein B7711_01010 [Streptococcus oralis subsp. oralis]